MLVCNLVGFMLTLSGTVEAGRALWVTHKANANGVPISPRCRQLWRWFRRRVLRRPGDIQLLDVPAIALTGANTLTLTMWSDPPQDGTKRERIDYLTARVTELHQRLIAETVARGQDIAVVDARAREARVESRRAVHEVEEAGRLGAISTIPMQLRGLFLVGAGAIVSVLPAISEWA